MRVIKMIQEKLFKAIIEGNLMKKIPGAFKKARLFLWNEWQERLARVFRNWLARRTVVEPNKVFFIAQEDRYCCNPKYICEEFRKRREQDGVDVDLVWRSKGTNRGGIPEDCRIVAGGSLDFYKELFSSRYVIANSVLYVKKGFRLKKEQVSFQTWHGSLGIKRFGKNDYKGGWHWVKGAIATGRMTDYCITDSTFVSNSLRNTYWENTPMLEYGHPRNDIMFDNYQEVRDEVRAAFLEQYDLPEDVHFIMYGPTFRDNKNFAIYEIDPDGLLEACEERFGGTWILLLRYHSALRAVYKKKGKIKATPKPKAAAEPKPVYAIPINAANAAASGDEAAVSAIYVDANGKIVPPPVAAEEDERPEVPRIIDVTDYNDMQELITIADIAITDYSSWIYDFMLQRRPGFIFAMDIALYNNERGFCYPLETTPFPIAITKEQLNENIRNFDAEKYAAELEAFLADKGCVEDGHASERTVDFILKMMEKEKKHPIPFSSKLK